MTLLNGAYSLVVKLQFACPLARSAARVALVNGERCITYISYRAKKMEGFMWVLLKICLNDYADIIPEELSPLRLESHLKLCTTKSFLLGQTL